MYYTDDTIVAISSAAGSAARGIIRLTGPDAIELAAKVFQSSDESLTHASGWRYLEGRCELSDSVTCPAQLYLFRTPHSYTTQDMVELHLPGSQALLQMVMTRLLGCGARQAQPGEFTARAFLLGRIDLTEAEAVAAVINARSDSQLRAAEILLDGRLHHLCTEITSRIADILALVEAQIDFSEEDIELATPDELRRQIESVYHDVSHVIEQSLTWEDITHLPRVVVAGPANAGKSSLVNALLGLDRSIISPIAGTTRDLLSAPLTLDHGECMLIDTAGLGDVPDPLAEKTQYLSQNAIKNADLLLWVYDINDESTPSQPPAQLNPPANTFIIANKIDLCPDTTKIHETISKNGKSPYTSQAISALRGDGLNILKQLIDNTLHLEDSVSLVQNSLALNIRQRIALVNSKNNLNNSLSLLPFSSDDSQDKDGNGPPVTDHIPYELLALELRNTLDHLESISGQIVNDEVLDRIFSRFCIGK